MQRPRGERGSTLLDAVVGTALMLVVFIGIVGAFRLTVIVVSNNKARAGAIALANERLEFVRSLPYNSVGTVGGIPSGSIAQSETIVLNDVSYTRRTFISYEDDPADGTGGADTNGIRTDFKAAKASVSWTVRDGTHTVTLISRISPPGIETAVPGGTLVFNVVDAVLTPVSNAQIRIVNPGISPAVDMTTYTDTAGLVSILGTPPGAGYRITVTKSGYSTAQTYGATATNTNPTPTHLGVALNQTTAATFAIDVISTKIIETYTPVRSGTTTEEFADESGIASSNQIAVSGGSARIAAFPGGDYPPSATLTTQPISTSTLSRWKSFSWQSTEPVGTDIMFRIYDAAGATLVPDSQIPGNSAGLATSPVNLSGVSTSTFPALSVQATLQTTDASSTPELDSYMITMDSGPHSLPNIGLTMTGAKTIGTTGGGALVYKYQNSSISSGATGVVTLTNIEWDSYTVGVNATTTYAISSVCYPQPETLSPNSTQSTRLILSPLTTNSLLVDVKSAGVVVSNATVRLQRGAYDITVQGDGCGNSFFSNLSAGSVGGDNAYTIDVSASGYQPYSSSEVNVSGTTRLSIILNTI